MAKTLIGQLILRLRAEGLGEAKKLENVMDGVQRRARALGSTGTTSWGVGFQKQIDKLKLARKDMEDVQRSWINLHESMNSRSLAKAMRNAEVSHWRTNTLSHLASQRAEIEDHFKKVEASAGRHGARMAGIMRAVFVAGGYYTAAYGGGLAIREGLMAGSNERRVMAEAKYAGLSADERGKIDNRSNELAGKYRLNKAEIFEVMKEASLSMPSTDSALRVSEEMAKAYVVLSNMMGPDGAIAGLRAFNKGMDNIEKVTPEQYRFGLENYMKAQQVAGKDIDPAAFAEAIKYSRTSGKVFGDDFLFKWMPFLISETGGSDVGTQLRAFFDQMVVGRASKQAQAEQAKYGLRDKDGRLVNQEGLTNNPLLWIQDELLPRLKDKGVDTNNETELARVIGELTNNRLSSDLISRAILSMDQYRRLVEERLPQAYGLDAAADVQKANPFAAFDGFKNSLQNLSGAMLPMDSISAGLNRLADGINVLAEAARENPALTALGLGVTGAAAVGTGKYVGSKLMDAFGLRSAAVELTVAAKMLQGSAGGDLAGDLAGGGKKGGIRGLLALSLPTALAAAAAGLFRHFIWETSAAVQAENRKNGGRGVAGGQGDVADLYNRHRQNHGQYYEAGGFHRVLSQGGPMPTAGNVDFSDFVQKAEKAGAEMKTALDITAKPTIALGNLQQAVSLAQQFINLMQQANSAGANAGANAQMRRNMADYGVAP